MEHTGARTAENQHPSTAVRVVAVDGGSRPGSSTALLTEHLLDGLAAVIPTESQVVAVSALRTDLAQHDGPGTATSALLAATEAVTRADVVVVATPVHHGTFSGLFKLFVDALGRRALAGTTVLLAATGGSARHTLVIDHALRPLFSTLGAVCVPTGVYLTSAEVAGRTVLDPAVQRRIESAAADVARLVRPRALTLTALP